MQYPILKQGTHLPVMVDVTHSTGRKDIMLPTAKAALAVVKLIKFI
jgi:3-deoxy-7-phosphoheptulonate synthase/chorismate mutase